METVSPGAPWAPTADCFGCFGIGSSRALITRTVSKHQKGSHSPQDLPPLCTHSRHPSIWLHSRANATVAKRIICFSCQVESGKQRRSGEENRGNRRVEWSGAAQSEAKEIYILQFHLQKFILECAICARKRTATATR